jgi:phenylacetate-CoA ligase
MSNFYDKLETRDPELRERELFAALPNQIAHAKSRTSFFANVLREIDAKAVTSLSALARLPVIRKSELHQLQRENPPFGGLVAVPPAKLAKIFVSPGPIYDPEGRGSDFWRTARALFAAGFREGDIVQNCFSYHLTPAGSMFETGLMKLGCAVVPAGVGQTDIQAATMSCLGVTGYVGTPSFLKLILGRAEALGNDVRFLRKALVSGEAFLAAQKQVFEAHGVHAYQAYGTADLGIIAYETSAREGLVVDEGVIVEIVRPVTGDPVPEGEVGEVVVTTFNPDYPLIRFATGDLSAFLPGRSPCGRTNVRIRGWMGRADQTAKVRGMFVHPHQVAEVAKLFPAIRRACLRIDNPGGEDRLRLFCVLDGDDSGALRDRIALAIREVMKLRSEVEFVAPEALPNDGMVIEDARTRE